METSSARMRLLRGNHGQQDARAPSRPKMQRDSSAEDRERPVGLVIVDEGPAAAHGIFHIGEERCFPIVLVVFPRIVTATRNPAGTTMQVGQISMSSSTTSPGS